MMTFIMMTLSFTVAILLTTGLTFVFMTSKFGTKLYMKLINKYLNNMDTICDEIESK